ncbi:MAG: alpha-D-ribose 1-methylphosphonate 5-triphosphate diphosphatase [Alphaproteobacteria bacterium]
MNWILSGGRVLRGDALERSDLHLCDGLVAERPAADARRFDAGGMLVLPGIVDIHGDGFERQIMPRPKVSFDLELALAETDRQLVANGITTAFHGLTVSWEPGLRCLDNARTFVPTLERMRPGLACDTRLHLRWETFALDAMADVEGWLDREPAPILAFNDHTTSSAQNGRLASKLGHWAARAGVGEAEYVALVDRVWSRRDEVPAAIERLAGVARDHGAILLAHDEATPDDRQRFRALGAHASEFPVTVETARAARAAGEDVILGAPNVVRGGSHTGALDATAAVADDLCSVLASDYYYPTLAAAAFKLAAAGQLPFHAAWALVSANPARAAGLPDRGALSAGMRGDVIVVDDGGAQPRVVASFVAGRKVYEAG